MKRNVSVVRFKFRCNILISGRIIKEMPGSVASGKQCSKSPRCNTSNQPAHYSVDAGSKVAGAWSRPLIPPPHQVQVSRLRVSIIIQIISHKLSGFSQGQLYIGACLSTWYTGDKRFTANVWFTVHRHSVWIRNQLDVTFVLSFISLLQVAQHVSGNHVPIFRSWRLRSVIATCWYCAVAAGRLSEPVSK